MLNGFCAQAPAGALSDPCQGRAGLAALIVYTFVFSAFATCVHADRCSVADCCNGSLNLRQNITKGYPPLTKHWEKCANRLHFLQQGPAPSERSPLHGITELSARQRAALAVLTGLVTHLVLAMQTTLYSACSYVCFCAGFALPETRLCIL